jgi:NADP-dependent 3-hydroxy acid dehydrogenase YdfG
MQTSAMQVPMVWQDQIALVSGASGGLGGAIAIALSERGVQLCLVGRNLGRLAALRSQLLGNSGHVYHRSTDLTKEDEIEALRDFVERQFGRLDILVHCSGSIEHGRLESTPISAMDRQYLANVRGPLMLTQAVLPLLKKPCGQVIFINSSLGITTRAATGYYAATQHASKALADSLREEVNTEGIRVTSIFTGRTATPRIQSLHASANWPYQPELLLQPSDVASVVVNALSLPWSAEVTNITIRPMRKSSGP